MSKTLPPKRMNADAAALFDTYQTENEAAREGRRHDNAARSAKTAFLKIMGDATRARLPDGRIVLRIPKSREMPAKDASTQQWDELLLQE